MVKFNTLLLKLLLKSSHLIFFILLPYFLMGCTLKSTPVEKTFRLAWENSPRTIDPRYSIDADSQYLADFVHCSLISFDSQGKIQNQLASELKWIDPKILEITLSSSFRFSNGRPVTAADVQASYEFYKKDLDDPTPRKASFSDLKKVEILSPKKVRFYFSEPNGEFLYNLSGGILPKEQAEESIITDPKKIIGCGKFTIRDWKVGHILLERREEDSSKDVQFIRIEIVKDENTRLLKLRNNELDLVQNSLNRDQLLNIQNYKNLKLLKKAGLNTGYLAFQLEDPILQKKKVRQAIAHAIDRKKIMDHIFHGWALPATTLLIPGDPYFNQKLKPVEYDIQKSKKLLDEAGFPMKGMTKTDPRFMLKLKTTTNPTRLIIAHAVADELRKVGINVEIETMDWGKFKSDVDKGIAQMWTLNWIGFKGPDIYRYAFSTQSIPPNGANRGRFSNLKLDGILEKAKKVVNFETRRELYNQAQEIIQEELPYVFLWHEEQFAVLNTRVKNYEIFADGRLRSVIDVSLSSK